MLIAAGTVVAEEMCGTALTEVLALPPQALSGADNPGQGVGSGDAPVGPWSGSGQISPASPGWSGTSSGSAACGGVVEEK